MADTIQDLESAVGEMVVVHFRDGHATKRSKLMGVDREDDSYVIRLTVQERVIPLSEVQYIEGKWWTWNTPPELLERAHE